MDVEKLSQEINQLSQIKWLSHDDAVIVFEFARCVKLLTDFEAQVRADERKSPTITKLVQALRFYADPAMWDCDLIEAMQESGSGEGSTEVPIFTDHGAMAKTALAELEKP